MPTSMIMLEKDGVLVEIQDLPGAEQIAGALADKVEAGLEQVEQVLNKVTLSLSRYWNTVETSVQVEKVEVELGLSFEAEGNVFISKAKATANLGVTLTLTKTSQPSTSTAR